MTVYFIVNRLVYIALYDKVTLALNSELWPLVFQQNAALIDAAWYSGMLESIIGGRPVYILYRHANETL